MGRQDLEDNVQLIREKVILIEEHMKSQTDKVNDCVNRLNTLEPLVARNNWWEKIKSISINGLIATVAAMATYIWLK